MATQDQINGLIERLRVDFYTDYPTGIIPKDDFIREIKEAFGMTDPNMDIVLENFYSILDRDGNGADLGEFCTGIIIISEGTIEQKAQYLFNALDLDGNGTLDTEEIRVGLKKSYQWVIEIIQQRKYEEVKDLVPENFAQEISKLEGHAHINERVERILEADTNKDGVVSLDEWLKAVETNQELQDLLLGHLLS